MKAGELWESVGDHWRTRGTCEAVRPNDSRESPGSWVMRRLHDGHTLYAHQSAIAAGEWRRVGLWRKVRAWCRRHGLAPLGYAQEDFRHHHQLLRVWGPLMSARWEVYRWPVGTGNSDLDDWMEPLTFGSSEAYHRIQFSAECVYSGDDWKAAKRAMSGRCQS